MSNIYGSRGGEWGSGHPTYTEKHTHMRARILADHRDVGLLRNTGIDPLPRPPPQQFKKLSNQHSSVRQRNTWSPPLEATIWMCVCNYFNLTVCKWMLAFFKISVLCRRKFVEKCAPQRLEVLCSSRPLKNALRQR